MEGMKWESFYEQFAYDPLMGSKNKEVGSASSKQNPFIADPAITCEPVRDPQVISNKIVPARSRRTFRCSHQRNSDPHCSLHHHTLPHSPRAPTTHSPRTLRHHPPPTRMQIKDGTAKMSLKDRKEAAEAAEAARQSREGEGGEEPITVFGGGAINRKASYTMGLNDDDSNRSPIRYSRHP